MNYSGTLAGQTITGFGPAEHTAALYRKWELADIAAVTVTNLPEEAFQPGGATRAALALAVSQVDAAIGLGDHATANQIINNQLLPGVATLSPGHQPFLGELLTDTPCAPAP